MTLNLDRATKNLLLIASCGYLLGILIAKIQSSPELISNGLRIWMIVAAPVLLLSVMRLLFLARDRSASARARTLTRGLDAALFLTMGAALGLTIASAIRAPAGVSFLEWIWLASALVIAALHYSPSSRDEYTR